MFIKLLLVYAASYIGCRLIVRFLKEQKMIDVEDDPKIACVLIAPLMFISLIVATCLLIFVNGLPKRKGKTNS